MNQIRRSQIISTFGPGSMIDLPDDSIMVGGLELWGPTGDPDRDGFQQIFEDRLIAMLRQGFKNPTLRLFSPPVDSREPQKVPSGIAAWKFPEWFVAQHEEKWGDGASIRSRPLVHARSLVRGRHVRDKNKFSVVPIRFVQACVNGHISDIDWYVYVHGKANPCKRPLWLDERGTSGDLADVIVRCECKLSRSLVEATKLPKAPGEKPPLGYCKGARPWLGPNAAERCGSDDINPEQGQPRQPNKLLVRSASNAYFTQLVSAISIPDGDEKLRKAVEEAWEFLEIVEDEDDLAREMKRARVKAAVSTFPPKRVLGEILRRSSGAPVKAKGIKQAELETLLASEESIGEDAPEGDFYAKALPLPTPPDPRMSKLARVVLVHRLREVVTQIGFTRFEPVTRDVDYSLELGVRSASLARDVTWLPAVENRGEGIFLAFRHDAIESWLKEDPVKRRKAALEAGFAAWEKAHPGTKARFPGVAYVMLHSLSHLLITAVSLECGYAASSIRERVYVGEAGYGILLYTGTPDAEGTLGGLVQVGRKLEGHLENALELGALCSNDPVCAQHAPQNPREERFLQGAACHGCLLISESSCEWRNEFLDRALVVPTVEAAGAEFFTEPR